MMKKSKNELDFAVKIWRNLVVVPGYYAILLQVMRYGFTIGRLVTGQQTKAGLAKVNHQRLWFVEANLNQKIYFVYSLNEMVLFLYIVLIKARL